MLRPQLLLCLQKECAVPQRQTVSTESVYGCKRVPAYKEPYVLEKACTFMTFAKQLHLQSRLKFAVAHLQMLWLCVFDFCP